MTLGQETPTITPFTPFVLRDRYRITERIGSGSFGITYLAEDMELPFSHQCIVKRLQPTTDNPEIIRIATRFFEDESKHLYRLGEHSQIPCLYACFQEDGEFYLVQEYIDGKELSSEIDVRQPWNEKKTIAVLKEILEILAFVHKNNVIHRDIKPDNIIRRNRDGKLVLIDFGAVKKITTTTINSQGYGSRTVLIGTEGYMPKEQGEGYPKLASDIHAVGIIGILGLTGQISTEGWRERRADVSAEFAEILEKMIHSECEQRYQNASEALDRLNNIDIEEPTGDPATTKSTGNNGGDTLHPSEPTITFKPKENKIIKIINKSIKWFFTGKYNT